MADGKEYHTHLGSIDFQLSLPTHYIQAQYAVDNEDKEHKPFSGWAHGQDPVQALSDTANFPTNKFQVQNRNSQLTQLEAYFNEQGYLSGLMFHEIQYDNSTSVYSTTITWAIQNINTNLPQFVNQEDFVMTQAMMKSNTFKNDPNQLLFSGALINKKTSIIGFATT